MFGFYRVSRIKALEDRVERLGARVIELERLFEARDVSNTSPYAMSIHAHRETTDDKDKAQRTIDTALAHNVSFTRSEVQKLEQRLENKLTTTSLELQLQTAALVEWMGRMQKVRLELVKQPAQGERYEVVRVKANGAQEESR